MVPPQTALHWAAKHGNADIVKLIAGTYQADVNARSVSVSYFTREPFRCLIILQDEPTALPPLGLVCRMYFRGVGLFG